MEVLFFFFFASIGACIGSFVGVLSDRLPRGENILISRSHCDKCGKTLGPLEMIPIFSYLKLMGKCSKCKTTIPLKVFLVEILTSILFLSFSLMFFYSYITLPLFIFLLLSVAILLAVFFADLEYGIIPDELVVALLLVTAGYIGIFTPEAIINHTLTAVASFLLFFALFYLTGGRGMGFGDVKLALVLGFMLGFPLIVVGLYGAFLTGAAVSIILILWRKKKMRGDTIPFGPFLVFSSFISLFFGQTILTYFLGFIL